jgi:short-subunit dehydrogenase
VLVTGASSGIGAAVARRLAATGRYDLLLTGRDTARLTAVARQTGGRALPADLTPPQAGAALARRAVGLTGQVDALIACAGAGWYGPFAGMPPETIDRLLAVNLAAPLGLVRELLPAMARHGRGHVVLLSSIAGSVGVGGEAVYSATKSALGAFADALRYEAADHGVRVSVVLPAIVDTPFLAARARYTRRYPRVLTAERVADAVHDVLARPRDEVFVPRWMRLPAALHGAAPGLYRALARRFT